MPDLNYDDVRKILAVLDASTLDEVHIEIGDFKLDVRRRTAGSPQAAPPGPALPAQRAAAAPRSPARAGLELTPGQFALFAPMLGTFYRAPAPGAPPFVEVGSDVQPKTALCIVEVMKLMNTIVAERPGRVAAILAEDATLVEFGQPLLLFDPL